MTVTIRRTAPVCRRCARDRSESLGLSLDSSDEYAAGTHVPASRERPMTRHTRPFRRGAGTRRAVSALVAGILAATLSAVPAQAREAGVASGSPAGGVGWKETPRPFRLSFLDHGRPLIAQAAGETAGPGGRMAYALADRATHRLTEVVRSIRGRGATTYIVGTDEAARTARVTVRSTPRGLRVEWQLEPSTGVTQVYEALTG